MTSCPGDKSVTNDNPDILSSRPQYSNNLTQNDLRSRLCSRNRNGFYPNFRPWFAKCYIPEVIDEFKNTLNVTDIKKFGIDTRDDGLNSIVYLAIKKYISDVKTKQFPSDEYNYPIKAEELDDIKRSSMWLV